MFKSKFPLAPETRFKIVDAMTLDSAAIYTGKFEPSSKVKERNDDYWYSPMLFSEFTKSGFYKIQVSVKNKVYNSFDFRIGK